MDIVVVLPAPLWPSRAVMSPSFIFKLIPFTAGEADLLNF